MTRLLSIGLLGVALLAACDRRVEPFDPDEKPEQPDLSRIFPPEITPDLASDGPPSQPPAPPGMRGQTPAAAAAAGASAEPIRGTILLAPDAVERAEGRILFIFARTPEGGPPLAAKRVQSPTFPHEFTLGPEDRMIQARPFAGPLLVSARLDADGNATTKDPADPQAVSATPVFPGSALPPLVLE
jgi:hypothetical protein